MINLINMYIIWQLEDDKCYRKNTRVMELGKLLF